MRLFTVPMCYILGEAALSRELLNCSIKQENSKEGLGALSLKSFSVMWALKTKVLG